MARDKRGSVTLSKRCGQQAPNNQPAQADNASVSTSDTCAEDGIVIVPRHGTDSPTVAWSFQRRSGVYALVPG
jgi:hypothetical protein